MSATGTLLHEKLASRQFESQGVKSLVECRGKQRVGDGTLLRWEIRQQEGSRGFLFGHLRELLGHSGKLFIEEEHRRHGWLKS